MPAQVIHPPMCLVAHKQCGEVAFCPVAEFVQQYVFLCTCLIKYHLVEIEEDVRRKNDGENSVEEKPMKYRYRYFVANTKQ